MAREWRMILRDDFDPEEFADTTLEFVFGNVLYTIDVTEARAQEFSEFVKPFCDAAHSKKKIGKRKMDALTEGADKTPPAPAEVLQQQLALATGEPVKNKNGHRNGTYQQGAPIGWIARTHSGLIQDTQLRKEVREWGITNGHEMKSGKGGYVPITVIEAFVAAHPKESLSA